MVLSDQLKVWGGGVRGSAGKIWTNTQIQIQINKTENYKLNTFSTSPTRCWKAAADGNELWEIRVWVWRYSHGAYWKLLGDRLQATLHLFCACPVTTSYIMNMMCLYITLTWAWEGLLQNTPTEWMQRAKRTLPVDAKIAAATVWHIWTGEGGRPGCSVSELLRGMDNV